MKKTIKIPWKEFVELAVARIHEQHPTTGSEPKFMSTHGYEGDSEIYDTPSYVEIEIL
jgi:hypothetical protein